MIFLSCEIFSTLSLPPEKCVLSPNSSCCCEDFKGKHFYWNSLHLIIALEKKTNLHKITQNLNLKLTF